VEAVDFAAAATAAAATAAAAVAAVVAVAATVAVAVAVAVAIAAVAVAVAERAPDAETGARRATASRKLLIQYNHPLFSKESGFFVPGPSYSSPDLTVPTTSKSPVTTSPSPTKVFVLQSFPSRLVPK
jgi:hypothetical protein